MVDLHQSSDPAIPPRALRASLRIVGCYLLLAGLWIVFSDKIVALMASDAQRIQWLQTLKGTAFVIVTGLLLLWLCYARFVAIYRAKQRLLESNRQYQHLLSNLPGMAYRRPLDSAKPMQFVSGGCSAVTGYRSDELTGHGVLYEALVLPDDLLAVRQQIDQAVAQREPYCMEYRIQTRGGDVRWVWERGRAIFNSRGRVVALEGLVLDIDDRKRAAHLEIERQRFARQVQERDQALSIVGHELRTPLAALRAISELLITDDTDAEHERQLLQGMNQETIRMSDMINDMLETSRLQSGRTHWEWGPVPLARVCQDALDLVRPLVDASKVRLSMEVQPPDLEMNGDEAALRRVLINLLSNAVRHTTGGSIHLRSRVVSHDGPSAVCIQVCDTGRGIPPALLDKLGIPFALSTSRSNHHRGGTGLGLAICRQIVSVHGGRMAVRSTEGVGTTFTLTFPPRQDQPRAVEEAEAIALETVGTGAGDRV